MKNVLSIHHSRIFSNQVFCHECRHTQLVVLIFAFEMFMCFVQRLGVLFDKILQHLIQFVGSDEFVDSDGASLKSSLQVSGNSGIYESPLVGNLLNATAFGKETHRLHPRRRLGRFWRLRLLLLAIARTIRDLFRCLFAFIAKQEVHLCLIVHSRRESTLPYSFQANLFQSHDITQFHRQLIEI